MQSKSVKFLFASIIALALSFGTVTAANAMPIIVRVVTSDKLVNLQAEPTDLIESLRTKISASENIAPANQLLKFGNTVLENGKTLNDYNIKADTLINLSVTSSVNCSVSGSFAIIDNVVTANSLCTGEALIPTGVKSVADNAFYSSAVTAVTLPSSLTRIGNSAFAYSTNLANLNFVGLAPVVGISAFTGIAASAKANVLAATYGFGAAASSWNSLAVNVLVQAPPTAVTVSAEAGVATISWSAVAGATNYRVTASSGVSAPGTASCRTATTTCSISGLPLDASYVFSVTATNEHTTSVAATSAAFLLEGPFAVQAVITATGPRIGAVLTASSTVNRSAATLRYSWFRCVDPVPASTAAVARTGCIEVSGTVDRTYTPPVTDIGWYITVRAQATLGAVTVSSFAASAKPIAVAATAPRRSTAIGGYAATAIAPSAIMKLRIKGFLVTNPGYTRLVCTGDVTGLRKSASQLKLAASRAKAACSYAKSLVPSLVVTSSGKQSRTSGAIVRTVGYSLLP
jgi:hypothetical protein